MVLAALLALSSATPAAAGAVGELTFAYVIDFASETLFLHTVEQPGILEPIAPLPNPAGDQALIGGCDTLQEDNRLLYCIETKNEALFFTVDVGDGTVNVLGPANALAGVFTALAVDPTTSVFYTVEVDLFANRALLYTVDPATGFATLVTADPITNVVGATGAAFDAAGQLYLYDTFTGNLLAVDKTTAVGTVIGPTGFESNFNASLDFSADGTCYLWGRDGTVNELRTCDPTTGATVLVGGVGVESPGGNLSLTGAALASPDQPIFSDGFESGDTVAWSGLVE